MASLFDIANGMLWATLTAVTPGTDRSRAGNCSKNRCARAGEMPSSPPTRRAVLSALRQIASETSRPELRATLRSGRTVYQDAGDSRVERIERDGTRAIGRLVNRRFTVEEPKRATRRR
jgi:hypothetical protein